MAGLHKGREAEWAGAEYRREREMAGEASKVNAFNVPWTKQTRVSKLGPRDQIRPICFCVAVA